MGKTRQLAPHTDAEKLCVSIIIPVRDDPFRLRYCLDSLLRQTYGIENLDIIVVDDGSVQPLTVLQAQFPEVRFLRFESPQGSFQARNHGIRASKGVYIAFLEAFSVPEVSWVEEGLRDFSAEGTAIVGGRLHQSFTDWGSLWATYELVWGRDQSKAIQAGSAVIGNLFVRKELFERVGLFDATLPEVELEFARRARNAGYQITYQSRCVIHLPANDTFLDVIRLEKDRVSKRYTLLRGSSSWFKRGLLWIDHLIHYFVPLPRPSVVLRGLGRVWKSPRKIAHLAALAIVVRWIEAREWLRRSFGGKPV